jgi:hypothetical protein
MKQTNPFCTGPFSENSNSKMPKNYVARATITLTIPCFWLQITIALQSVTTRKGGSDPNRFSGDIIRVSRPALRASSNNSRSISSESISAFSPVTHRLISVNSLRQFHFPLLLLRLHHCSSSPELESERKSPSDSDRPAQPVGLGGVHGAISSRAFMASSLSSQGIVETQSTKLKLMI